MLSTDLKILDQIEAPIFVIDANGGAPPTYAAINEHACKISGLSRDDVIGKTARQIFEGPAGEAAFRRHVQTVRCGQTTTYKIELPLNGEERPVTTTLTPVLNAQNEVTQLIGVTILHQSDPANDIVRAGIKELAIEAEQFISLAAHDLRTPMRNVKLITEMILDDFEDLGDGKVEMIRMLERVASGSMHMISQLLALANATDAKAEVAEFDIRDICSDILLTLDPSGRHKVTCPSIIMTADRAAFQIVIRNLIDNAFKHSQQNIVEITITTEMGRDGVIKTEIKDNGVGFPDPTIAFLDSGELRVESGFGLLGIRRLVEARGGNISARMPENHSGSIIRFNLPGQIETYANSALQL